MDILRIFDFRGLNSVVQVMFRGAGAPGGAVIMICRPVTTAMALPD